MDRTIVSKKNSDFIGNTDNRNSGTKAETVKYIEDEVVHRKCNSSVIGERVQEYRLRNTGLKPQDMADKLGISLSNYYKLEQGSLKTIDPVYIAGIASILGCSTDHLILGEDKTASYLIEHTAGRSNEYLLHVISELLKNRDIK